MAFLLDLPPAPRAELAARWAVEETTAALHQAMTDGRRVERELERIGGQSRRALELLAREPASLDELLAGLASSRDRLEADLDQLGALGLVLRLPPGRLPPRSARAPFGADVLFVAGDIPVG